MLSSYYLTNLADQRIDLYEFSNDISRRTKARIITWCDLESSWCGFILESKRLKVKVSKLESGRAWGLHSASTCLKSNILWCQVHAGWRSVWKQDFGHLDDGERSDDAQRTGTRRLPEGHLQDDQSQVHHHGTAIRAVRFGFSRGQAVIFSSSEIVVLLSSFVLVCYIVIIFVIDS